MPVSHRIHERHESEVGKGDRWHCLCCGYILSSSVQPQSCPECGHGKLVIIESGKPRKKK